ncbi:MAG: Assymetric_cell_division_FstX, partial [uncultured Solirubrobacteraceae bacterium]
EDRVLLPRGDAVGQPQRRPELRRARVGARHRARARRVHPDRPGDDRRGQRGARARHRRRLPEGRRGRPGRRARPPHARRGHALRRHGQVRLQGGGVRGGEAPQPGGLRAARVQPAPRHVPHHAGRARERRGPARRARCRDAEGRDRAARPGRRRGEEPARGHGQDPVRHAGGEADDRGSHRPPDHRVDPARGEHDPTVAVRAPSRGRGDEARRRDELVHPMAVHHRGRDPRRDGRGARRAPAARRQGRVHRPVGRGLRADRRARHDGLPHPGRAAARRERHRRRARVGAVAPSFAESV